MLLLLSLFFPFQNRVNAYFLLVFWKKKKLCGNFIACRRVSEITTVASNTTIRPQPTARSLVQGSLVWSHHSAKTNECDIIFFFFGGGGGHTHTFSVKGHLDTNSGLNTEMEISGC